MARQRPFCLSIAGHDPSAGAGLLADAKVFNHLKVQGLYVATCNTIQTAEQFEDLIWHSSDFVLRQLALMMSTYHPRYIKIGLIEDLSFLQQVLDHLKSINSSITVVWDPIISPTARNNVDKNRFSGNLSIPENVQFISTPNQKEFDQLGAAFFEGHAATYIKNGDATERRGVDQLKMKKTSYTLNPKIKTNLTKHGTGCTFSSALTAHLALNYPILKSAYRSKRITEKLLLSTSTKLGHLF